jgi:TolA protein
MTIMGLLASLALHLGVIAGMWILRTWAPSRPMVDSSANLPSIPLEVQAVSDVSMAPKSRPKSERLRHQEKDRLLPDPTKIQDLSQMVNPPSPKEDQPVKVQEEDKKQKEENPAKQPKNDRIEQPVLPADELESIQAKTRQDKEAKEKEDRAQQEMAQQKMAQEQREQEKKAQEQSERDQRDKEQSEREKKAKQAKAKADKAKKDKAEAQAKKKAKQRAARSRSLNSVMDRAFNSQDADPRFKRKKNQDYVDVEDDADADDNGQVAQTPETDPDSNSTYGADTIGPQLAMSDRDRLRKTLYEAWMSPARGREGGGVRIVVQFWMNRDGTIARAKILHSEGTPQHVAYEAGVQSVQAVIERFRTHPLPLKPDTYEAWKEMEFEFTPVGRP